MTKINWVMLFKEISSVYSDNHTKPTNKKEEVFIVEAGASKEIQKTDKNMRKSAHFSKVCSLVMYQFLCIMSRFSVKLLNVNCVKQGPYAVGLLGCNAMWTCRYKIEQHVPPKRWYPLVGTRWNS
jgi:hypothetical protein